MRTREFGIRADTPDVRAFEARPRAGRLKRFAALTDKKRDA
jgi:hypothetical protein